MCNIFVTQDNSTSTAPSPMDDLDGTLSLRHNAKDVLRGSKICGGKIESTAL